MVCGSYGVGNTGLDGPFKRGRRCGIVDGIEVIELELPYENRDSFMRRGLTFLRFAMRSTWLALSLPCDVVFATSTPLTAAIPGIAARGLRRRPFIFEVRDLWPELPKAMGVITNPVVLSLMSWLEWSAYHSATSLIGLSPGIVDGIRRRAQSGKRVALVPNGSDLDMFAGRNNDSPAARAGSNLACIFMGAHGIANGLEAVLDAAGVLKARRRDDIEFLLIGDGGRKPALKERAASEKLDNVHFLDPVPKNQLRRVLQAADVGLMILADVPAFYYGTSPNKFFDYIAAGLPVVNNYPGWLADMIRVEGAGIAVAPDDPNAFADALEFLADHPDDRLRMGQRARQLAERDFDRDSLARDFVAEFETLGN